MSKFCTKCGAQIPEGALFCMKCGIKVSEGNGQIEENAAMEGSPSNGHKKKHIFIAVGVIGFVVVIALLIMVVNRPGIDLTSENTVGVEFSGGNGRGFANYYFNDDFFDEFQEKILGKNPSNEKSVRWYDFLSNISYEIDPNSGLSNGDEITLTAKWDEDIAKELGISVKGEDRQITVEGLEPATQVDVFENLDVTFNGYNGYGTIDLTNTSTDSFSYEVYFEADKYDGLSNGDRVKVTASVDSYALDSYNYVLKNTEKEYVVEGLDEMEKLNLFAGLNLDFIGVSPYAELSMSLNTDNEFINNYVYYEADKSAGIANGDVITVIASVDEDYAAEYGYTITKTSKEYTVDGLDEYIDAYSDITKDVLKQMNKQTEDIVDSWIANQESLNDYIDHSYKIREPEYVGTYFLKLKDGIEYDSSDDNFENAVYVCYKARLTEWHEEYDLRFAVKFSNFIKYSDGTVYVDIIDAKVGDCYYYNYEDFYDEIIRCRKRSYEIEEYE